MSTTVRLWFHRARAGIWLTIGVVSYFMQWYNSIALVWIASLYANIASDWSSSEAADNRDVIDRLDKIEKLLREHIESCQAIDQHGSTSMQNEGLYDNHRD